jgi:hypothetical protein
MSCTCSAHSHTMFAKFGEIGMFVGADAAVVMNGPLQELRSKVCSAYHSSCCAVVSPITAACTHRVQLLCCKSKLL